MIGHVKNNKLIDITSVNYLNYDVQNIEVSNEIYSAYQEDALKVIFLNGEIILNPDYEEQIAQKEAERIAMLHLRRGDVFRGLLHAKGATKTQLRAMIEAMPDGIDKEEAFIDFDDALEFYRGVALVDTIGTALGITSNQMTEFFETNDYQKLNT